MFSDNPMSTHASVEEYPYIVPTHVVFEITENCNLNCVHCYRIKDKKPLYLKFNAFRKILNFLISRGLIGIEITGGEPTLHSNFLDIVEYAAKNVSMVGILTNGAYLPPETIERLEPYKEKIFFSISLDSYDPNYHDRFRGLPGAWKRTVSNIKRLTSAGYQVRIAMTVTPNNIDHIEKTAELAINLGAKMFTYSPMLPFGRANGITWSNADLWKLSEIDKRVREKFKSIIPVVKIEEFGGTIENCGAGWRSVTIGPDMILRMCVISDSTRDSFVRIDPNNVESAFIEALDGMTFFYTLRAPGHDVCGDCKFLNFCSPCILRARYVLEKGFIHPSQCKWAQEVGMENLKKCLKVRIDE
ncbi:radical SAM protein [Pyrococcus sp.]|uniref:radical SAM protein n=1 Tax=Pyrococcus sp. TaxID=33866 RepID=UPI0025874FD5|nr:radical SAM protein [Pyrococcus sp.]